MGILTKFEVIFLYDDYSSNLDAPVRGYRSYIFVKIMSELYHITAYDIVRLRQDMETELEYQGFFPIEPNIILVREVTKEEILTTIKGLYENKYFDYIKPLNEMQRTDFQKKLLNQDCVHSCIKFS